MAGGRGRGWWCRCGKWAYRCGASARTRRRRRPRESATVKPSSPPGHEVPYATSSAGRRSARQGALTLIPPSIGRPGAVRTLAATRSESAPDQSATADQRVTRVAASARDRRYTRRRRTARPPSPTPTYERLSSPTGLSARDNRATRPQAPRNRPRLRTPVRCAGRATFPFSTAPVLYRTVAFVLPRQAAIQGNSSPDLQIHMGKRVTVHLWNIACNTWTRAAATPA